MTTRMSRFLQVLFFGAFLIFVAAIIWTAESDHRQTRTDEPSYGEFMQKVEAGDVREVTLYVSSGAYELEGEYSRPMNRRFHLAVFKEAAPDITRQLREKGVLIKVKESPVGKSWLGLIVVAVPILLLAGFFLLLERRLRQESAGSRALTIRTGIGYDLHRLEAGRKLIVGGIELEFDKGPAGHSDGDVVAHALCDALLGAAGLGDIGTHFPDTDAKWKGADSMIFLQHARKLLDEKKLAIEHVDAVVILERPKLGPHFPKMREALGRALGVEPAKIHLKAKTNEGVDAVGRGEAIAAYVVATLVAR
jgi:2-C-methyl-D-erythritol 2,4-cyclodiphosphate synthase